MVALPRHLCVTISIALYGNCQKYQQGVMEAAILAHTVAGRGQLDYLTIQLT